MTSPSRKDYPRARPRVKSRHGPINFGSARRMPEKCLPSGRVELPTFGLGNRCSIQLSYEDAMFARVFLFALPALGLV
jgi:hypothetical protein